MTLYNADCLEVLKTLPDKSVDLVVTDPPYLMGQGGGGGAFGDKKRQHLRQIKSISQGYDLNVLNELLRVLKRVNIYLWCNKDQLPIYYQFFKGYKTDLITWHKTNPTPACNGKYLPDTEYCLFVKESGVPVFGTYQTKKKYYVSPSNTEDKKKYRHPTIKPLPIIENLIINSSQEGETVLDPFAGVMTTGVACKKLNRNFIGVEIEPKWYEIGKARLEGVGEQIEMEL